MKNYLKILLIAPFLILVVFYFWAKNNKVYSPTLDYVFNISEPVQETKPTIEPISIMLGGDVMLGRWVERAMQTQNNWRLPLENISQTTQRADLFMVNLESPFLEDASTTPIDSMIIHADPKGIETLKTAGVDMVSLANNHITDAGQTGLKQTFQILNEAGIKFIGAGETNSAAQESVIVNIKNNRIGILSYTYGVNFASSGVYFNQMDQERLAQDIQKIKPQTDLIIVSMHAGAEYAQNPNASQISFAHRAIDEGASIVFGHHPHVLQKAEKYNDGYTFYSLGTLVFDQAVNGSKTLGALINLKIENKKIVSVEILPTVIKNYSQVEFLEGAEKEAILNKLAL